MSGQATFAGALLDASQPCPSGLHTWNGSDPARRFAVYRNNVVVSLVDALADTFPVCRELVGDAFFRAMAQVYVVAHPPRERVLARFGRAFPVFVETFEPAAAVPYLADVARLEMLRIDACHAADAVPVSMDAVAAVLARPEGLPALRISAHPSVAVLQSRFAVFALWAAHQGADAGAALAGLDPLQPQSVLVLRVGLEVQCVELEPACAVFLERFIAGVDLAAALAETATDPGFDLGAALAIALNWQLITALHTGDQ